MEIIIENSLDNNLFEEVAFYKGMLGEFSYDPRKFCITFADIKDRQTDVLRYIGKENVIELPQGVMAVPYLLREGYDEWDSITIVNHSTSLIDIDYMLYKTCVKHVELKGFQAPVYIQTAERTFEFSALENIDLRAINLSRCTNMVGMFANTNLTAIDLSSIYLKNDTDMREMFKECATLERVRLFNNGADKRIDIHMDNSFAGCRLLKDLQIYDADELHVENYNGDIASVIPKESPLYHSVQSFVLGFVPEFDDALGVQLNEAFRIRVINEYSMLIRKCMPKDMLNNVKFIFRMLQELKLACYGTDTHIAQIHFVSDIAREIERRKNAGEEHNVILVQPRQMSDSQVVVYALYLGKEVKGYRIKYNGKFYDITPAESVELGYYDIPPCKQLKLHMENEEYKVTQIGGEEITIYGYDELVQDLEQG